MVKIFISLLLALLGSNAFAVTAAPAGFAFPQSPTYGPQGPTLASYDAACSWGFNQYKNTTSGDPKWNGWASYSVTGALCNMKWSSGGVANNYSMVYVASSCPANSTGTAPTCTCKAGYLDMGDSCKLDDAQEKKCRDMKGTEAAFTAGSKKYPTSLDFCVGGAVAGCGASFTKSLGKEVNGVMTYTWFGAYTGGKCGATQDDPKPSECKGTWGQVNGVNVCLSAGTDPATSTSTKTVESGSKTTTSTPAPGASAPAPGASGSSPGSSTDGTTTTGKETTCTGTKCQTTTTTTKTNPDGSKVTENTTKDEPKEDYCKENPKSFQCKEYTLGDVEAKPIGNKEIQLGIAKAEAFGPQNGSCPAPKTVQVMGISLSMPFTLLCEFAIQIKPLLIGFAWLSSILTFFGFARK